MHFTTSRSSSLGLASMVRKGSRAECVCALPLILERCTPYLFSFRLCGSSEPQARLSQSCGPFLYRGSTSELTRSLDNAFRKRCHLPQENYETSVCPRRRTNGVKSENAVWPGGLENAGDRGEDQVRATSESNRSMDDRSRRPPPKTQSLTRAFRDRPSTR